MRTWGSIRVELDRKGWEAAVPNSLHRLIIDFLMGNHQIFWEIFSGNCKAMVLTGKVNATRSDFTHRMVEPTVAEFHLVSSSPICLGKELMAHTNPKNWNLPLNPTNHVQNFRNIIWISRTIGQHDPIRIEGQDFFCLGIIRNHCDIAVALGQLP